MRASSTRSDNKTIERITQFIHFCNHTNQRNRKSMGRCSDIKIHYRHMTYFSEHP